MKSKIDQLIKIQDDIISHKCNRLTDEESDALADIERFARIGFEHEGKVTHDDVVVTLAKCSERTMHEVMYAVLNTQSQITGVYVYDKRAMLVNSQWTTAEIMVRVPRKMTVESHCHATNLEFFSKIRGVRVGAPIPGGNV